MLQPTLLQKKNERWEICSHQLLSDTENGTVLVLTSTQVKDHLESPVSKNHRNQMSWKTAFGPIVPAELADMEYKDHESIKKKKKKALSSVVFCFSRNLDS